MDRASTGESPQAQRGQRPHRLSDCGTGRELVGSRQDRPEPADLPFHSDRVANRNAQVGDPDYSAENIDLDARSIYIPQAKAGARTQPISADLASFLADYLETLPRGTPWLFPSIGALHGHTVDIRKAFVRAVNTAGLDPKQVVRHLPASPWRDAALVLVIMGFGMKIGLVPLHGWMPLTYTAAPIPAAAVLSGAAVKAGVIGLIRFLPFETALPGWGDVLVAFGFISAFYGVAIGITQHNLMGFVVLASGEPSGRRRYWPIRASARWA
jgi:Proton-conducting membrane transporter